MSTIVCELHHSIPAFDWTGFYRVIQPGVLAIGPYQGSLGCLRISFDNGICGKTARTGKSQIIPDVSQVNGHIACSTTTRSEITIPVFDQNQNIMAVLDVDSNELDAFDEVDRSFLEEVCDKIPSQ